MRRDVAHQVKLASTQAGCERGRVWDNLELESVQIRHFGAVVAGVFGQDDAVARGPVRQLERAGADGLAREACIAQGLDCRWRGDTHATDVEQLVKKARPSLRQYHPHGTRVDHHDLLYRLEKRAVG